MNKKSIEKVFEKAVWHITKYANDADHKLGKFYERIRIEGNALVNEGINEILTIIGSAASGTKFDNTNAYLIVGTNAVPAAEDPTDTEATFQDGVKAEMMTDPNYPTYGTGQKITWKSSFGGEVANQAWGEFGVLNGSPGGKLLNRKVDNQGTKIAGQTWELELEITLE